MDGQRTILSEYPKKKNFEIMLSRVSNPLLQNHILARVVGFSIAGHICLCITRHMGFFVKLEFYVRLISSTIDLTRV